MRRGTNRIAVLSAIVLALTVGAPVGAVEKPELPVSWLLSLLEARPLLAGPPPAPEQQEGSAEGRDATYDDTKEPGGAGRAATPVKNALDAYEPYDPNKPKKTTGEIVEGFDEKTSEQDESLSTQRSEVFDNADGSVTTKTYPRPVNFQDGDGEWKPIDVDLERQSDGRLHAAANSLETSVATAVEIPEAVTPAPSASPSESPSAAPSPSETPEAEAEAETGTLLSNLELPTGESVGYSLVGAAPVTARVDGNVATYPGILPQTDLELETFDSGIKETMVLQSPQAANSWIFPLTLKGLTPRAAADGGIELLNKDGKAVAWFPRGSMKDSLVDPKSGSPAESTAVAFEIIEYQGGSALKVEADRAWLNDPARVYPVRVDPTQTTGTTGDVMIDNDSSTDNNGDNLPVGTYNGGTTKARSFIHFDDFATDGFKGKRITAAKLKLYLTWAYSCDTDRVFQVRESTEKWTVADLATKTSVSQSPSYSAAIGTLTVTDPGAACTNSAANRSVGKWVTVNLDAAVIDGWSKGEANYGLALTASETDSYAWKRFTSANHSSGTYKPVLELTYSNNVLPQVNVRYPANNAVLSTLTPELLAKGSDADKWPNKGLTYVFTVLDTDGKTIVTSPAVTGAWTVPAGKLSWNSTYLYTVRPYDQVGYGSYTPAYAFSTNVPQPVVTGNLAQNGGKGFDSSIGNYTTSATDANVATVGPSLAIERSYNSLDTRRNTAFGVGWASILDAKASQVVDAANTIQSVRVTYPTGSEVAFGRTSTGTYVPPSGRFSTFVETKSGTTVTGYTLTDKDATVYTFGRSAGSGVFRLTAVTDANGRSLTIGYGTDGNPSMLTSASGRKLTVAWSTPVGGTAPRVATIATDRVDAANPDSANTWKYSYTGDQLTEVCQPNDYTKCWKYEYAATSQHGNTVLNNDPTAYWPLNEAAGKTVAQSRVLANAGKDSARYNAVTLGTAGGPLAGSTGTVATFNGTSSYAQLPANLIGDGQYQSVSMWFKTATAGGVLLSYNADPMSKGTTTSNYTPALYIDKNGKLRGEFWMGAATPITSTIAVTDNKWHHLVLAGDGDSQRLYLDGAATGAALTGTIASFANGSFANINVGAGYVGNSWPDHANTSVTPAKATYFTGQISDVAFFNQTVTAGMAASLAQSGTTAQPVLTGVVRPSGGVTAKVAYDTVSGRVAKVTDENGGDWVLSDPSVVGSSLVYAGAVLGAKPRDYWRFTETDAAEAVNEVAGGTAVYNDVTLGGTTGSGPFADTTAAQFNGTSSYIELPTEDIPGTGPHSVEMWFKMPSGSTKGGVLYASQIQPTDEATTSGWTPALYVGIDGKLRGGFWTGSTANQAVTTKTVNDGKWHHVALAATTNSQTLYLDGAKVDTKSGALVAYGAEHAYIGTGRWSGGWPSHGTADIGWWPGAIAEAAVYDSTLTEAQIVDHVETVKQTVPVAMTMISGTAKAIAMPVSQVTVTTPAKATQISHFDLVNGNRMVAQTDERGKTTQYGYDVGGFSNMVYDPNGVLTQTLQDVRGNTIQSITCQDQNAKKCSSVYFSYFPDATTKTLTPNPKNDLLLTTRDGRSSSATDNTYLTTNEYDAKGNQTAVTDALGRVTRTTYTDATTVAADGGTPPAGLPLTMVTAGGARQSVTYFKSGDVAQVTEPNGAITRFVYDALGRAVTQTEVSSAYPDGVVTTNTYDRMDRLVTQLDPPITNRVTGAVHTQLATTVFDADGNVLEEREEDTTGGDDPRVEKHGYNGYGQEITSTTPGGATTTFAYDSSGRMTLQTSPDGTVTSSEYDAAGNVVKTWLHDYTGDPNNPSSPEKHLVEENTYDNAGRLSTEIDAMKWVTTYTYTDNGLPAKTVRSNGDESFVLEDNSYDADGNILTEVTNNGRTVVAHTWDAAGRETSTTSDPGGLNRTTVNTYDVDDKVVRVEQKDASGTVLSKIEALYDKAGRVLAQTSYPSKDQGPVARWKLNEGTGTRLADSAGNSTLTTRDGVYWSTERGGSAYFSDETSITTTGPVVDTRRDFTVSAWVNLYSTGWTQRMVSGGGGDQQSPFDLSYDEGQKAWRFATVGADAANTSAINVAKSTTAPVAGQWTHLAGTYDATAGMLRLYVNGKAEGTDTGKAFGANSSIILGAADWNGAKGDFLAGGLSDVQLYQRALSATEVTALAAGTLTAADNRTSRTSYTYDENDDVTSVTDPNGHTSYTTYDQNGGAEKTTAPAAMAESLEKGASLANAVSWTGYNTYGEVTDTKDALGNWSVTYYDADGRPTLQRAPTYTPRDGSAPITPETIYTYTASGEAKTITDPMGNVTRFEYDQLDRMSKTVAADGRETTYTYDKVGDLLSTTDPTGAVSSMTWDYLGRQVTSSDLVRQDGKTYTTTNEYDQYGRQTGVVSPDGIRQTTEYNALGEPVSVKDAANNVTKVEYDGLGQVVKTILADNSYSTTTYDAVGQPVAAASYSAAGARLSGTSTEYDAAGNTIAVTDARGTRSTYEYDATGLLVAERQPINGSDAIETSFGYDLEGNQTRFTDGRKNAFWSSYNSWGLRDAQIEPETAAHPALADRTFTTVYDAGGRAVKQIQPGGVTVTNSYDILGQLTGQKGAGAEADTVDREFQYDAGGRIKEFSGVRGSNEITYDDRGMPRSIKGTSGDSAFTYTGDGSLKSRVDAAGTTKFDYDTAGRLSKTSNADKNVDQTYTYNNLNAVTKVQYGTGNKRSFTYDAQQRLTGDELTSASGASLAKIEYGWNANDSMVSKKTTGFGGAAAISNTYTYDLADRLTSWNDGSKTTAYAYDKSGNRLQNGDHLFTYDARNRLLTGDGSTYTYTARGSLRYAGSAETKTDAFGQVASQAAASGGTVQKYEYDALGRVVKDGFSYTGSDNDLAADGQSTYVRGAANEVLAESGEAGTRYAWTDLHSDLVGQFTATGASLDASVVYDPLGKVVGSAGGMIGSLGYQSEWTDTTTSRVNMMARWYNVDTGQFDTRDTASNSPVGNSVAANRYQYGDANPLTTMDPTGHWGFSSMIKSAVRSVSSTVSRATSYVSSYTASAYSYARSTYHAAKTVVKSTYKAAKKVVKAVHKTVKRVAKAVSKAKRYVHKAIKKVKAATKKFVKAAVKKAAKITKAVVKKAKAAGKLVKAVAKRVVKNPVAAIKDAAKATAKFVVKHKDTILEVAAIGLGVVAGLACTAVTAGVGAVACMVGAGALINLAKDAAQGDIHSIGDALGSLGTGALSGLAGGAGGAIAGKVGTLVAGKVGTGLMGRVATEAVENGVEDVVTQAVTTGRVNPKAAVMGMVPGMSALTGGGKKGGSSGGGLQMATGTISLGLNFTGGASCPNTRKPKHSFDPDTPVLMADGSERPIEDVNVGDEVVATDPESGESTSQQVTQLHLNTDHEFTDLTVVDQDGKSTVLNTTQNHPFWNETDQAWTDAENLEPGDQLKVIGEGTVTVQSVRNYEDSKEMRDLTVAVVHTYYVLAGDEPVLVHNCGNQDAGHGTGCRCEEGFSPTDSRGHFLPNPNGLVAGELNDQGLMRGTNATGFNSSRGSFRSDTVDKAWKSGTPGPTGGIMCPRQGPNCVGEVFQNPSGDQKTGDLGHYPIAHTNRWYPNDRAKALDLYNQDIRIECIPCNRGAGNRQDGVV
ncbi:LamG-like jellyroll fold domain-containing protein [Actinoplanes sp. NBRC 101535]|uniref:LamG-like jellyroll fold domain-containing protein n=1 Tax=Actinoplanes sp. NBRC 101535 TaxID=3032196 RepID=UPI0024A3B5DC|nr:LamG-like jellyroll fold domain-containing protein [Actinoplanes sp. NBRC 101535]GLY01344.1 hypothetical protein Acsp01_17230 [Actinoplanes sp. NBRC 101535]